MGVEQIRHARQHTLAMNIRRGFTTSSLSFWVFLLFILVSCGHLVFAMSDPRWQAKAIVPYLLLFVAMPLLIATAIAFAAWFVARKSDPAGNFAFCTLLMLMILSRLAIMTGVIPKGFSFRDSGAGAAMSPAPAGNQPPVAPTPLAPAPHPFA